MEAPARNDAESIRNEKVKVLAAMETIQPGDLIRGQFHGYLDEPGVARDSHVETFAALRVSLKSWRWSGVPIFIRAGKQLPVTCTEVVARLKRPPATLINEHPGPQNYVRLRISPEMTIAMAVSVTSPGNGHDRCGVELVASRHQRPNEMDAYERVLTDAMAGDQTLFARQDYVEEAWRIVDPVLAANTPLSVYEPHTWGPSTERTTPPGGWDCPHTDEQEDFREIESR
jgi:glucose-6-phosphate 1-dehydrogenase